MCVPDAAGGSFEEVYRDCYGQVVGRLVYLLGDRAAAEDVAQEAFLRLYTVPPPTRENLLGWLYRVGARLAMNYLRGESRRRKREKQVWDSRIGDVIPLEEVMWRQETVRAVREVLLELPDRDRIALLLRHTGFSYREIAQVIDVAPASVGNILARAQRSFLEKYKKRKGDES
ncbi:MAG TPA: sigma-70 family RNA polymerase sigma factor [Syntrophomonadaceae bacterium]|nr:sigma-70 family RNA polymerase sigma factor [Syntrophomonadaceae bacterium]